MNKLLNWILKIRTTPLYNNTRFINLTKYKEFAFWGTLRNRMYYDIQKVKETNQRLYRSYSSQRFIGRFSYLLVAYFLFVALVSKIICLIVPQSEKEAKNTIFATTDFPSMRVLKNPVSKRFEFGHSIFRPIFQKIFKNYPDIRVASCYPFGFTLLRNLRIALNMRRSGSVGNFSPLESYASIGSLLEIIRAKRYFGKMLRKLKTKTTQNKLLSFSNIDLVKALPNYFEYYFQTFLPLAALYLDLCQRALKRESPDTILLVDEYLLFGRSLLYAATDEQIPTFAIQHGIIYKFSPAYFYDQEEISQDGNPFFPYSPLPTKIALYGKYHEQILTKYSKYPKSRLVVTGQPRYDVLKFAKETYSRSEFCRRYNLNPTKRIALLITQPFPIQKSRTEFIIPTSQALSQIKNLQIVVKPHPNESSAWYKELLTKQGIDATILSPKSDTNEAIFACDLFIAVNSTTIIEALILNKPVVVVNLSNFPEVLPWVSDGAAIEVTNQDDLLETFLKVLDDEQFLDAHSDGRTRFLTNQIYKDDGKATDRVIAVLETLISSN